MPTSDLQVHLPGPFLCYTPPEDLPEVQPDLPALLSRRGTPAIDNTNSANDNTNIHSDSGGCGVVCFGSFNNLAKVNDKVLDLWCEVLRRQPNSRMLLKCKPFACARVRTKVARAFAKRVSLVICCVAFDCDCPEQFIGKIHGF